jgi:Alginate lyase
MKFSFPPVASALDDATREVPTGRSPKPTAPPDSLAGTSSTPPSSVNKHWDIHLKHADSGAITVFEPLSRFRPEETKKRGVPSPALVGYTAGKENIEQLPGFSAVRYRPDTSTLSKEGFTHPGILLDLDQLKSTAASIATGDPMKLKAYHKALNDPLASMDYKPSPVAKVECGLNSNPNRGCTAEVRDAQAAYTQALLWYYSKDDSHANKSVEIMNAWANTLKNGHKGTNAPLQASWAAQLWTRAAEIIRHTSDSWTPGEAGKFETFLLEQYLPDIKKITPCHYGNWHASAIEARANIGVFTNRMDVFKPAIDDWRARVPAFIYDQSDGRLPAPPPGCKKGINSNVSNYWQNFDRYENGLTQETGRDLEHTAYALSGFMNTAETARIQNIGSYQGLFEEQSDRLTHAMEFHSKYANGAPQPGWLTKNGSNKLHGTLAGTFEIGYRNYSKQEKIQLPETAKWLEKTRPTKGYFHYLWETLTHGVETKNTPRRSDSKTQRF